MSSVFPLIRFAPGVPVGAIVWDQGIYFWSQTPVTGQLLGGRERQRGDVWKENKRNILSYQVRMILTYW